MTEQTPGTKQPNTHQQQALSRFKPALPPTTPARPAANTGVMSPPRPKPVSSAAPMEFRPTGPKPTPQPQDVYDLWKNDQSPENTLFVVEKLMPELQPTLRSYGVEDNPVLRSRAKVLVAQSLQNYDPKRGPLLPHIKTQLQRMHRLREQQRGLVLNKSDRMTLARRQLETAEQELYDSLGREPSTAELADHTGFSVKKINQVRVAGTPGAAEGSFINPATGMSFSPATRSTDPNRTQRLAAEFIYPELSPRDKLILEHSLGLFGRRVLRTETLAARLKISPSAVSQRKAKLLEQLNSVQELSIFRNM